jgi:hypothetical protein
MSTQPDIACFTLNPYKEYCGTLLKFKHIDNGVVLTVEVNQETWEAADLLILFNLRWDKRHPGKISGTKPVQISMFLDRTLYKKLKSSGELLMDKEAFMMAATEHPMRGTASWFATEVTEEVDLPEELKEMGTLREGFSTHWKDTK